MATISAAQAPVTTSRRIESVDLLRGLVMVLMALDHTRDFFSNSTQIDPTDPTSSWPALFLTRWVTHLCAPTFMLLAGAGAYFQIHRGKSRATVSRFLLTRGLWLVFLELTVLSFAWFFRFFPTAIVIWALGWSMVGLAALIWLPLPAILGISVGMIAGHNLLDGIRAQHFGTAGANVWKVVHQPGMLMTHGHPFMAVLYPLIPWMGVMSLGYCAGAWLVRHPESKRKDATLTATAMLAVFVLLRLFHGYGDAFRWQHLPTAGRTVMSFFELLKYPPSLQYLLATLGCSVLIWVGFDWLTDEDRAPGMRKFFDVYGRVPFFYYTLHIFLLHLLAMAGTALVHLNWRWWVSTPPNGSFFMGPPAGWGFSLPVVYAVWISVVLVLYAPCLWFSRLKASRKDWWLSYL